MGTWGVKVFEDDDALDVRDMYIEKLVFNARDEAAEEAVLDYYQEDLDSIWVPLAVVQWKKGRLSSNVKINALRRINEELESLEEVWGAKKLTSARRAELNKVSNLLCAEMPARKKVRMPSWAFKSPFLPGNVVQFKLLYLNGDLAKWIGKYALLEVVGITQTPPDKIPCEVISLRPYNWYSDTAVDNISSITNKSMETVDFYFGNGIFLKDKSIMPTKGVFDKFEMRCVSEVPLRSGDVINEKVGCPCNSTLHTLIASTLDYYFKI